MINADISGNNAQFNEIFVGPVPIISFIEVGSVNSVSIPTGIGTTVTLDTVILNTAPEVFIFHDSGVEITVEGYYLITAIGQFTEGATTTGTNRILQVTKQTRSFYAYGTPNLNSTTQINVGYSFACPESDFVSLIALQDSGATLSLRAGFQIFHLDSFRGVGG